MNSKQKKLILEGKLGKKNIFRVINEIRNTWGYVSAYEAVKDILYTNTKSCREYHNMILPKDYEELYKGRLFEYLPEQLERELNWYVNCINIFSEEINKYVFYKNKYENFLIQGKYDKAESFLDKIETEICVSIWGLDNRFVLAEYDGGLEKNKQLLADFSNKKCHKWISIMAEIFSFKSEKGVNNRQYLHRMNKIFSGAERDIAAFFEEKLYPLYDVKIEDVYSLLFYNERASVIDMYNVFIKTCIRILSDDEAGDELKNSVTYALSRVSEINDIVLYKLKLYIEQNEKIIISQIDRKMFEIGNLYTEGQYEIVIEKCIKVFEEMSNCFEIYEYYVKAHILSNQSLEILYENTIAQDLINAMYIGYIKVGEVAQSYKDLCRIERIFTNSSFGTGIANFFVDKYMIGKSKIQSKAKEYMCPFWNIRYATLFGHENIYIWFKQQLGKGSSLELLKKIEFNYIDITDEKIEQSRLRWYDIKCNLNDKEKKQLLEAWYAEIQNREEPLYQYEIERISTELFYIYLDQEEILNAEKLYVCSKIKNKYRVLRMDLDEIYNIVKEGSKSIKKSICTPIIVYINNKLDYADIFSHTANFMELNNLQKPSDIFANSSSYDKGELIFFLKNVCTYEILDSMYFAFEDTEEVENERIRICQFLQNFDVENESDYINEISQILKNRKIMQGVKYIEDVKIDLDMEKIIEQHLNVFEDNFKRFQEIGNLAIEYKAIDVENNLIYIKMNSDSKKYNHKLVVFKEMLMDFRQELAFGKYGLDQTLGTRIRHGSMQNQLRVVFEKNNIIFVKRNMSDLSYSPSDNFDKICVGLENENKDKLIHYISSFSEKVDKYIDKLRTQCIKIKMEEINKDGLIDLTVNIDELVPLFEKTQKLNNEKMVLDLLEIYWIEKVKQELDKVRYFFDVRVKDYFIGALKELEDELHQIVHIKNMRYNLFDAISRSRTEIQNAINVVAAWFKLPRKQEYSEFDFTMLIETCETINNQVFPKFANASFEKHIDSSVKIKGRFFSYFVDILIIFFTNAYTHSGYINNISDFRLKMDISEVDGYVVLEICNNISNSVDRYEINSKIEEIKSKIGEILQTGQYSSFEGGSGFIKVCKILEWNISVPWKFEFGLNEEETHFSAKIYLEKKLILEKGEL